MTEDERAELLLLRAEIIEARNYVNKAIEESVGCGECDCRINKVARNKYGFAIGYAESAIERLLLKKVNKK